ncbi:YfhO family protein [Candidatus Omnitrophota bacterium]
MKSKKDKLATLIIFLLVGVAWAVPLLKNIENWGSMDWDQFTFWYAVPRESILRYHQFPLWNPYSNGGNVLLAHPHSAFLSPLYIFVLLFGPIIGLKLEIIIHLLIGMFGMFLLSKHLRLAKFATYLPAFVYMLSTIFTLHLTEGHLEWLTMAFIPWLFLFFLKGLKHDKYIYAGIGSLALIIMSGGVYVSSILAIMLFLYSCLSAIQNKSIKPLKIVGIIFIGAFFLSAIKLIPMLEFLRANPRRIASLEATEISLLPTILLSREQGLLYQNTKWTDPKKRVKFRGRGFEYGWHEYGAYVGWLPLVLAIIGLFFYFRTHWPLLLTGLTALWISLGAGVACNLWGLIHQLPIYNSLHVPSRFLLGFLFTLAIFSGLGLSKLETISVKKHQQALIKLLIGVVVLDLLLLNFPLLKQMFTIKPVQIERHAQFQQRYRELNIFSGRSRSSLYPIFLSNSGIINGYEIAHVKKGEVTTINQSGYKKEAFLLKDNGNVRIDYFSPNKIVVEVDSEGADRLVLNQNYDRGWRVQNHQNRKPVESFNGLIAAVVSPGQQRIIFSYLPFSFIIGSLLTAATIIIGGLLWKKNVIR